MGYLRIQLSSNKHITVSGALIVLALSCLLQISLIFALPIFAVLMFTLIGTFLLSDNITLDKRLVFSFVLNFAAVTFILLILGIKRIKTFSDEHDSFVFLTILNIIVSTSAFIVQKKKNIVEISFKESKNYLAGSLFFIPFVVLAWFRNDSNRNSWALVGWDHSGQHLAQIIDLNSRGSFFYEQETTLYPRAIHSYIAQFNALRLSPDSLPEKKLNNAFEMLIAFDWIGSILALVLLLLIFKELSEKLKFSRTKVIVGSLLIGWIYSSDQFLLWPLIYGWSSSLVVAWLCLAAVYGHIIIESTRTKFLFLCLIGYLVVHSWTLVFPFILTLQFAAMIQIYRDRKASKLRKSFVMVSLGIFLEATAILPVVFATIGVYNSASSFSAKNFVPEFFQPLLFVIIISSVILFFKLHTVSLLRSRIYIAAVLINIATVYVFAIMIDSPLNQLYYYPAKLLWNYLLLLVPFVAIFLLYSLKNIAFEKHGTIMIFTSCIILFSISLFSAKNSWNSFANTKLIKSSDYLLYPTANKKILQESGLLNYPGPIVIWNKDGYDPISAYWVILSGHPTISPFDANDSISKTVCQFFSDNPNTTLVSRNLVALSEIRNTCQFTGRSLVFNSENLTFQELENQ